MDDTSATKKESNELTFRKFTYRFDRRAREAELFFFVLRRAVRGEPLPYARLTAEVVG